MLCGSHFETTIFELATGEVLWRTAGSGIGSAISADGSLFAAAGQVYSFDSFEPRFALNQHSGNVSSAAFSPDGKRLATGGTEGHIKIWDVARGRVLLTLYGHEKGAGVLEFSSDGRHLLSCGKDGRVLYWRSGTSL